MPIDTSVLNIDFDVNNCSTNCKVLQVMDLSNWGPAVTKTALIAITTPGSTVPIENIFQKEKVNVFNSNNLGLSDVDDYSSLAILPDGVYKICVRVCMSDGDVEEVCKYILVDCTIRCQVSRQIITVDLNCDPCKASLLKDLQDVVLFLDAAQAQISNCNANKAMEYYRKAAQMLSRISLNSDGPCTNCDGITISR